MEDDFVVERSAVERMGMADDGGVRRVGRSGIQEGFQASGGAGQKKRADAGGFGEHGIRVQQLPIANTQWPVNARRFGGWQ